MMKKLFVILMGCIVFVLVALPAHARPAVLILDGETGKELWHFTAPSGWHSSPVVFSVSSRENSSFANGWGGS